MSFAKSDVSGYFSSLYLVGTKGIAGSQSNLGLFYTNNFGQNWTQSNITSGSIDTLSIFLDSSGNGLAGSNSSQGIYYTSNYCIIND